MYDNMKSGSRLASIVWMVSVVMSLMVSDVRSCWGSSSTNIGVTTPDPKILVGNKLTIDCSLFNTTIDYNGSIYEINSSMISFKFKSKYYSSSRINIVNETVAQLQVEKASVDDNGIYYCLLNISGLDHNPLICLTHVTVGYLPQNVKDFKCIDEYYRKLHCSWIPQNNYIQTSYQLEDRVHATFNSKYDYLSRKCGANPTENSCEWRTDTVPPFRSTVQKFHLLLTGKNEFGKNEQKFVIEHYSIIKPDVVRKLRNNSISINHIELSWEAPDYIAYDEDLIKHLIYEIRYFRLNSHDSTKVEPVIIDGVRDSKFTLSDLLPFSRYNISVRSKTKQAVEDQYWGEFESIEVQTKSDVPYLAPVLIPESYQTVKNTEGNRTITLYWKSVPVEHHNALGFHYSIEFSQTIRRKSREVNNLHNNPVNLKSDITTYTFIHMDSNAEYAFKIYGVNDMGISKNYSEIKVDRNDYIPHKPTNIDVFSYGGGRYEVQWGQPRDNPNTGPVVNYTVFWCQNLRPRPFPCEGAIDWMHTTNRSVALELPDIKTNYQFAVSADTQTSSSGMSWAECIVPIDGRLDKLSEVRLANNDSYSVDVIWKLNCPAQKRVVEGYKILYCKLNNKICHKNKAVTVPNTGEIYTLTGLEPFSEYKITVVALTDSGPSEESDPKIITTKPASPKGAPHNLTVTKTTSDSIMLSWERPHQPNGQISFYDIVCGEKTYSYESSLCVNGCTYTINGLKSFTSYIIKVRACHTKDLCGPFTSDEFSVRTSISTPTQMDPPRSEIINATAVKLSWSPPIMPNGPIDYYLLKLISRDNKTEPIVYNISHNQKEYYLSLDCSSYLEDAYKQQYAVSIVAVNKGRNEELVGDYSDMTNLNACLFNDDNQAYVIGIVIGGFLGLMFFVIVLYMLVRWMKRKVDNYNSLTIELPKGLQVPQLGIEANYDAENAEQFNGFNRTDSSPNLMYENTLPVSTDEDSFKNRHGSGISSSSTEGLIYRKSNNQLSEAFNRMESTDSGQHGSVNSYNSETHVSSDSGVDIDNHIKMKDQSELKNGDKVSPRPPLPVLDEMSSRNSDSSGSKDSGIIDIQSNGTKNRRKKRMKSTKNNKISQVLPVRNEAINPLYDCPVNHSVCIYSLLANSEPSIYDMPLREDDNILSDLSKYYKPEMAKSLTNIIQNSSTSDSKVNCVICDSNNSSSKSSTQSPTPNNHPYYKFGVKRQLHYVATDLTNPFTEKPKETKTNDGYIAIESIINNSEPNDCKQLKKRLEHDWSQNSYDAEVSSTSSNDNEQTDIITQSNPFHKSSTNFTDCEKIQNISSDMTETKTINSSVNPSEIETLDSTQDLCSYLNSGKTAPSFDETDYLEESRHEAMKTKSSPNHLIKDTNGYVLHNALTHLNGNINNNVKQNLIKNSNGYVVINDGIEMTNVCVPNNNSVNHMTPV